MPEGGLKGDQTFLRGAVPKESLITLWAILLATFSRKLFIVFHTLSFKNQRQGGPKLPLGLSEKTVGVENRSVQR